MRQALQSDKELSPQDYLGCDMAQFKEGMLWDNYVDWHIDHRVPLQYKLDEKTPTLEEVVQSLHYTNIQPLWASENIAKGNWYVS